MNKIISFSNSKLFNNMKKNIEAEMFELGREQCKDIRLNTRRFIDRDGSLPSSTSILWKTYLSGIASISTPTRCLLDLERSSNILTEHQMSLFCMIKNAYKLISPEKFDHFFSSLGGINLYHTSNFNRGAKLVGNLIVRVRFRGESEVMVGDWVCVDNKLNDRYGAPYRQTNLICVDKNGDTPIFRGFFELDFNMTLTQLQKMYFDNFREDGNKIADFYHDGTSYILKRINMGVFDKV